MGTSRENSVIDTGSLIAVVAVVGGLTIPITALFMDFRRRKLQFEERRAMIERGMTPPPLHELDDQAGGSTFTRDPAARREKSLRDGIISLFTGLGLGLSSWVLTVVPYTLVPREIAGPLAMSGATVGMIGMGLLVYYAVTRPRGPAPMG
jgi:hypothetical protein